MCALLMPLHDPLSRFSLRNPNLLLLSMACSGFQRYLVTGWACGEINSAVAANPDSRPGMKNHVWFGEAVACPQSKQPRCLIRSGTFWNTL